MFIFDNADMHGIKMFNENKIFKSIKYAIKSNKGHSKFNSMSNNARGKMSVCDNH